MRPTSRMRRSPLQLCDLLYKYVGMIHGVVTTIIICSTAKYIPNMAASEQAELSVLREAPGRHKIEQRLHNLEVTQENQLQH